MVVKSISRKDRNFARAVRYIAREREGDSRNLLYPLEEWEEGLSNKEIAERFEENAQECSRRKNGVYFYHDVISFSHLDRERLTADIMEDLALKYVELRAGQALAYGKLHFGAKCPHVHLVISANVLGKSKKIRLSKREFDTVKRELEACQRERYPFLTHSLVFDREKRQQRALSLKRRERERDQRLKKEGKAKTSEKDKVCEIVRDCLTSSISEAEFKEKLKKNGFEFYLRGEKTFGVQRLDGKGKYKKFRIKTLGLLVEYEKSLDYWRKKPEMEKMMEEIETDRFRELVAEMGFKRDVKDLLETGDSDMRQELFKALRANRELDRERIMSRESGEI